MQSIEKLKLSLPNKVSICNQYSEYPVELNNIIKYIANRFWLFHSLLSLMLKVALNTIKTKNRTKQINDTEGSKTFVSSNQYYSDMRKILVWPHMNCSTKKRTVIDDNELTHGDSDTMLIYKISNYSIAGDNREQWSDNVIISNPFTCTELNYKRIHIYIIYIWSSVWDIYIWAGVRCVWSWIPLSCESSALN